MVTLLLHVSLLELIRGMLRVDEVKVIITAVVNVLPVVISFTHIIFYDDEKTTWLHLYPHPWGTPQINGYWQELAERY